MNHKTYCINDICKVKSGKRIPIEMDYVLTETTHPYIRARDIKNGIIETENLIYLEDNVYEKIQKYIINSGDIAITIVGASVGDIAYANDTVDRYNLTENAVRLTEFSKNANGRYVFYLLFQKSYKDFMRLIAGASAQPKLGIYKIKRIKVSLPEREIQDKIVRVLKEYDSLIELNTKRIKALEQMAENLYNEWFVRFRFPGHENAEFENGIPKGWEKVRAEKAIIFNPTIKVKDQTSFTIIPMEALSTTSMVLDQNSFTIEDSITGKRSQNGDTLLAKITPCLENGKTGFVMGLPEGEVFGGSTEFVVMRSKTLSPYYVYFLARSHYFRQTAILSMNGADGRQRVSEDKLKSTKIIQPPKKILDKFDEIVSKMFTTIQIIVEQNDNLIKQRDLLLPRLMSGKLEV